jgi:hypothetical protein
MRRLQLGNWYHGTRHRSRQKRDICRNLVDRNSLFEERCLKEIGDHTIGNRRLRGTGDEARGVGLAYLSRFNQSGGQCARSLYRPVAVPSAPDRGGSAAGMGAAPTFRSADTQADALSGDRRPNAGGRRRGAGND